MKVLVVGSGGREHTIAWKLKQSDKVSELFCAPGNGGMQSIAECVAIKADDITGLIRFAQDKNIDLTVVGPEAPLAAGIVDEFEKAGLKIFGPSKAAAQLEGSKVFAKEFMERHGIPTAGFTAFEDPDVALEFLNHARFPLVIKADGLAAGKGVIICADLEEGQKAIEDIMRSRVFDEAGDRIIIEECLVGEEASILAISDGENFIMLDSSQDHKRIFDEDKGPNTGGMGAYSPAPIVTPTLFAQIAHDVIKPTIDGMKVEGTPFKGVLYAGLMMTEDGPKVLEFNVRLGDPETQAVLPRMKNDLLDVILASIDGTMDQVNLEYDERSAVCVVMSSGGYPGSYDKGFEITGLDQAGENSVVFHAGTALQDGKVLTSGGRVLGITGFGNSIEEAIEEAYKTVEQIIFDRAFFRRDIGQKALQVK